MDACSDKLLQEKVRAKGGRLVTPGTTYKVLLVPALGYVEPATLEQLERLAANGASIIFIGEIPRATPKGLPLVQDTTASTARLRKMIQTKARSDSPSTPSVYQVADSSADALLKLLALKAVLPDGLPGRLAMLRAVAAQEPVYFFKNESEEQRVDVWVPLRRSGKHAIVGNARTGFARLAQSRPSTNGIFVHLALEPTEVLVVRLTDKQVPGIKPKEYFEQPVQAEIIPGPWTLSWADYAGASHSRVLNELTSWTRLDGLELYSGTVDYETSFKTSAGERDGHWELDLGEVCHSAEVWVNDEPAGCAWTTPFCLDISRLLRPGLNSLRLRVANLAQNRIIEMQQKHLPWQ